MRKTIIAVIVMEILILSWMNCTHTGIPDKSIDSLDYLRENFKQPPAEYGVNCWWWWLNGNVTKEAITKDLEAMKSRNFQGAMIFDAGGHNQRGNRDIP